MGIEKVLEQEMKDLMFRILKEFDPKFQQIYKIYGAGNGLSIIMSALVSIVASDISAVYGVDKKTSEEWDEICRQFGEAIKKSLVFNMKNIKKRDINNSGLTVH